MLPVTFNSVASGSMVGFESWMAKPAETCAGSATLACRCATCSDPDGLLAPQAASETQALRANHRRCFDMSDPSRRRTALAGTLHVSEHTDQRHVATRTAPLSRVSPATHTATRRAKTERRLNTHTLQIGETAVDGCAAGVRAVFRDGARCPLPGRYYRRPLAFAGPASVKGQTTRRVPRTTARSAARGPPRGPIRR